MKAIKVEVIVRVPDDSRIENADVVDALEEALSVAEEHDDQSLWHWHEYNVEFKE